MDQKEPARPIAAQGLIRGVSHLPSRVPSLLSRLLLAAPLITDILERQ